MNAELRWPKQVCKVCWKRLDPARHEPKNSLHGIVCSEKCDEELRRRYGNTHLLINCECTKHLGENVVVRIVKNPIDLWRVARLLRKGIRTTQGMNTEGRDKDAKNSTVWFTMSNTYFRGYVYVLAQENGTDVAVATLIPDVGRVCYLGWGVIAPELQGQGLMRRIGPKILHLTREHGMKYLWTAISADNKRSRRAIESLGFNAVGATTLWDGDPYVIYSSEPIPVIPEWTDKEMTNQLRRSGV